MRRSVLVFVIFVVFTSVVLAARKPEQKQPPSPEKSKETKVKESTLEKAPARNPLKKEPNAKKPNAKKPNAKKPSLSTKPPVAQKIEEEQFEEEAFVDKKAPSVNKKPAVKPNKNTNKKKPTADASVPQPPKRGEKPPAPIQLEPDVVDKELPFELPTPPNA